MNLILSTIAYFIAGYCAVAFVQYGFSKLRRGKQ
jgi:hypothetical protein